MLQKPYDINIRSTIIPAEESFELKWKVSGDVQTSFKVDIYNNSNNTLAFTSNQITSLANKYIINANSLANGNEYKIRITVWNQAGNSISSDFEIFQTSSRPNVTLSPIGTVASNTYNFSATYSQAEGVSIRSYMFLLYDVNSRLISNSGMKTTSPIEHLVTGLLSGESYYIEVQVVSEKGITGTSGKVLFEVLYATPKININLTATNVDDGGIELTWDVLQIIGEMSNGTFINSEKLDVRNGRVWFDEGFKVNKDFTLKIWLEQPSVSDVANQINILKLTGSNGEIVLQRWNDDKFHVFKNQGSYKYHYATDKIQGNTYCVMIQQINGNINVIGEVVS